MKPDAAKSRYLKMKEARQKEVDETQEWFRSLLGLPGYRPTLKQLRDAVGISQKQMALVLGITASHYAGCERGVYEISNGLRIMAEMLCHKMDKWPYKNANNTQSIYDDYE